jgi:hypothetical protein
VGSHINIVSRNDRQERLTFALVFGGSGFFDDVGLGVGFGVEPSSHLLPIHVMMYVWRGTRACSSFAGALLHCAYCDGDCQKRRDEDGECEKLHDRLLFGDVKDR